MPSRPSSTTHPSLSSAFPRLPCDRIKVAFLLATATLIVLPVAVNGEGKTRKITVTNNCAETVYPAIFTGEGTKPDHATGWEAPAGHTTSFTVEEIWGGRIWPRTECDFTRDVPDYEQCLTGGCKGGLECAELGGTGRLPVTLAEFNIQEAVDHYDASNVDGFNVPLAITNSQDCPLANCPYDLRKTCPDDLQFKNDAGDIIGCLTDCGAHGDNEEYCCSGAHNLPETCPSSGIPNYPWWKKSCPIAYAYAYDESSGTALFTCNKRVDWTITFCPGSELFETTATLPNGTTISQEGELPDYAPEGANGGTGVNTGGGTAAATTGGGTTAGGEAATTGGGNAATATKPSATGGGETGAGGDASSTSKASTTGGSAVTGTSGSGSSSGGSGSTSGSSSDESSSSSASSDDTIFGIPAMAVYAIVAVIALLIIGAIAWFVLSQKKRDGNSGSKHRHHRAATSESDTGDDEKDSPSSGGGSTGESDDGDKGGGGPKKARKHRRGSSNEDDEDYSLAKFSALEAAERDAASRSVYAAAARDPTGLTGLRSRGSPIQLFTLPKAADYPFDQGQGRAGRAFET
ncbi:hypothetical protein JCM11251_007434 [Rhodosporidiobolus azoricus]